MYIVISRDQDGDTVIERLDEEQFQARIAAGSKETHFLNPETWIDSCYPKFWAENTILAIKGEAMLSALCSTASEPSFG